MSIKLFLADDNQGFRQALRTLLTLEPDLTIIGEAANGRAAVTAILQCVPDIAILDLVMPELNGIEATRQICQSTRTIQVIIISMYGMKYYVQHAFAAGARGYLLKEYAGGELVPAIHAVYAGRPFIGASLVQYSPQEITDLPATQS